MLFDQDDLRPAVEILRECEHEVYEAHMGFRTQQKALRKIEHAIEYIVMSNEN